MTRQSNIELLRLLSMLMIVIFHFNGHALATGAPFFSAEGIMWNLTHTLTITATSIFVLISGYFGINFRIKGVLRLYLRCAVWGVIGYLLYCALANTPPPYSSEVIRPFDAIHARQMVVHCNLFRVILPFSDSQCGYRDV